MRKSKNKWFLTYLNSSETQHLFETVEVEFLHFEDNHENIDKMFSQTSAHVRRSIAMKPTNVSVNKSGQPQKHDGYPNESAD